MTRGDREANIRQYLLTTDDATRWRTVLPADRCVMGSVEYSRIVESYTGCAARLLVVESKVAVIAYPFFLRPIDTVPFASGIGGSLWDTFTPEYTGPFGLEPSALQEAGIPRFADLFARHCREHGIVAEFVHLNPWCAAPELLDAACIEANREVVYIDLAPGKDRIWARSLTSDARRMTRKAQRMGVRVRHAESPDDVREFHRLYTRTMERRQAQARYFFPPEYFLRFFETMPETSFFALAEYQGRLVAGGLYLHGGTDVYWHLSAADMAFAHVRPVNGYVWEAICWALDRGKQRMLLGGGHRRDDGVFRFKASFSPLRARFHVYKRIHDADAYAALSRAWSANHGGRSPPSDPFPAYRAETAPAPPPTGVKPEAAQQQVTG